MTAMSLTLETHNGRTTERFHEHPGFAFRKGRSITNPSFSHIGQHSEKYGYHMSSPSCNITIKTTVLGLLTIESIHIMKHKPVLQTVATLYLTPNQVNRN